MKRLLPLLTLALLALPVPAHADVASPATFTDQAGDDSYPIAAFSWLIVKTSYSDANKGKAIVYLFKWLVTDGQTLGTSLQYAPLPTSVQGLALTSVKLIKEGGQAVLT